MNVVLETRVVGMETRTSAKGNQYSVVAFMDGADIVRAMVDNQCDISNLKTFEPVYLKLKVSLGKYADVRLMGWNKEQI